jgi:hypothetical protein
MAKQQLKKSINIYKYITFEVVHRDAIATRDYDVGF